MTTNSWVPRGFLLSDGSRVIKLLASADDWQINSTSTEGFALVVKPLLRDKWIEAGFIGNGLFYDIKISNNSYAVFSGKHGYLISSVQQGPYPNTNIEARVFAISLRETRKIVGNISLHDALYIEQISRLLPTYTISEYFDDQTVLGTWLSAGVRVSTKSFRRLCKLLDWMDVHEVEDIINEAGFSGGETNCLTKILTINDNKEKDIVDTDNRLECGRSQVNAHFSLPGRPYLEDFFNEHIVDIIIHEEKYRRMGIGFPSAIILHGPPGCGKTYAVERLIDFLDWPNYSIDSGSIGSPYIHDTSKKIADVFDKAINNAPSVIVIDEMEAFLTDRSVGQASGNYHVEEVAEFLRRIPDASKNHVLVIAMTNMIEAIDPAILRRGRFDHIIEVKMPSVEEVRLLLLNMLSKIPVSSDVDVEKASEMLKGRPVSDIAYVVKEAGRKAAKENKDAIDNDSLMVAIKLLPPLKNVRKIGFSS
ncbi:MAG: ATP-binding protein [Prolixibacteraceae bacterium]|nr:ATP-binding protein [Prolixibacteraceae bacterium]